MYLQELRGEVSQCDIFDSLPIACAQQQTRDLTALNTRALLLTYDCEYDKPSTERVIAAGIFLLSEVPANQRGNVRKNRVFSTFYLQASPLLEESFVDFRYMGLLEKAIAAEESQAGKRLVSLGMKRSLLYKNNSQPSSATDAAANPVFSIDASINGSRSSGASVIRNRGSSARA